MKSRWRGSNQIVAVKVVQLTGKEKRNQIIREIRTVCGVMLSYIDLEPNINPFPVGRGSKSLPY